MSRLPRTIAFVVLVLVGFFVAREAYRMARLTRETPRDGPTLTPMPGASSFEPKERASGPVLRNAAPGSLRVDFGYRVGDATYAYTLALTFAPGAEQGRAVVTIRHDGHEASTDSEAVRRWDEPRKAYAVALADRFMITPPVPSLCIKAVVGPDLARYDLADGTLCVAQRDAGGSCHPETLACGVLRP